MRQNAVGCAGIVLSIAVLSGALAYWNSTGTQADLQRVSRFRKTRAVITDKGVAITEYRPATANRPEQLGSREEWIQFECRVGRGKYYGSALSLFRSSSDHRLWESFEKGKEYDAHYDPETGECFLNIAEPPGGVATRSRLAIGASGIIAVLALAVIVIAKLRGRRDDAAPPAGAG